MKLYKLDHSYDLKEVGRYPQCPDMKEVGDLHKILSNENQLFQGINRPPEPQLIYKAKPTSLLSFIAVSGVAMAINDDFYDVLQNFTIQSYESVRTKVWQNDIALNNYRIFKIFDSIFEDYIDFSQSIFHTKEQMKVYTEEVVDKNLRFKNKEEYSHFKNEMSKSKIYIFSNKLVLKRTEICCDLFRFKSRMLTGYFVSEKLKIAMEQEGLTGISFKDIEKEKSFVKLV